MPLPTFKVEPVAGKPRFRKVTCPRRECGESHWVKWKPWREGRGGVTNEHARSCPYCFKSAWVTGPPPVKHLPKEPAQSAVDRDLDAQGALI
jgi:hypothetical protein